ncbi:hypothetical protein BH11BAC7_BH11BAC7_14290 [soil metagenome]
MQEQFEKMKKENYESLQVQLRKRSVEYGYYRRYFVNGSTTEQKIARKYSLLRAQCAHVANYYGELLLPVTRITPVELNMSIVFDHMAILHLDLAHLHEELKKQKGENETLHQHLEVFHRTVGHSHKETAEMFRNTSKTELSKGIKNN